jgi:hypothetical protein
VSSVIKKKKKKKRKRKKKMTKKKKKKKKTGLPHKEASPPGRYRRPTLRLGRYGGSM